MVNQSSGLQNYDALLAGQQLAQSYVRLVKSSPVLDETAKKVPFKTTLAELGANVSSTLLPNTQLIQVRAKFPHPDQAAIVANTVASVFISQQEARQRGSGDASNQYLGGQLQSLEEQIADSQARILELQTQPKSTTQQADLVAQQTRLSNLQSTYSTVLKNMQDIKLANASLPGSVAIVEPAVLPSRPATPRIPLNTALGGILGLLVAAIGIALVEHLDDKVNSPARALEASELPTLGQLYKFSGRDHSPERLSDHGPETEAYRMLRTNLQFASMDRPLNKLLVTSGSPGEGKTTVATSLAAMLARDGKQVILVDLDVRRPGVHVQFKMPNHRGLTNLLLNEGADLDDYLNRTQVPGLRVLTSGPLPPDPAELIGSQRLASLLDRLAGEVDFLVVDSSPVLAVTDPVILASRVDATLVVVDVEHTRMRQLRSLHEALSASGGRILGVALNRAQSGGTNGYHYYYYHSEPTPSSNGHTMPASETAGTAGTR